MIATARLYEFVKSLVTALPEIQHFDYWNDNVRAVEGSLDTPFRTPAVFLEVQSVLWDPSPLQSERIQSGSSPDQYGTITFGLHIVTRKAHSSGPDASEVAAFDVVEKVFRAVHFKGSSEGKIQRIQRSQEGQPYGSRVLFDWPMYFSSRLFEEGVSGIDTGELDQVVGPDFGLELEAPRAPGININLS